MRHIVIGKGLKGAIEMIPVSGVALRHLCVQNTSAILQTNPPKCERRTVARNNVSQARCTLHRSSQDPLKPYMQYPYFPNVYQREY